MAINSVPAEAEAIIEDVVAEVANEIELLLDFMMPNGLPFGMERVSEEEQVRRYLADGLHDNPGACANWIRKKVGELIDQLKQFGVPDDQILSIHPYDIVLVAALVWSSKMEELVAKQAGKAQQIAQSLASEMIPSVPELISGEMGNAGSVRT